MNHLEQVLLLLERLQSNDAGARQRRELESALALFRAQYAPNNSDWLEP